GGTVRLSETAAGKGAGRDFDFGHQGPSCAVAVTPSGRHLAVGLNNGKIALFATPAPVERQPGRPRLVGRAQSRVTTASRSGPSAPRGQWHGPPPGPAAGLPRPQGVRARPAAEEPGMASPSFFFD